MQPPPGSSPHPFGQGVVVAAHAQPWRWRLVLGAGIALAVVYAVLLVLLAWAVQTVPGLSPVLLLLGPLFTLMLLVVLGQALVMRGPLLVVDDVGIRVRDVVGWIQVPWSGVRSMSTSARGRVLHLDAPGGVFLNERPTRRSRQTYRIDTLTVQPDHLMAYLQHRHATAPRRPVQGGPGMP